jgi:hypothetical protein
MKNLINLIITFDPKDLFFNNYKHEEIIIHPLYDEPEEKLMTDDIKPIKMT